VVVLCKFTDLTQEPKQPSYFAQLFSDAGIGKGGLLDWYNDVSYGQLSISGTVIAGDRWYSLGMTRYQWAGLNRLDKIVACANQAAGDVNFNDYYGVIAIFNDDPGVQGAGTPSRAASTTLANSINTSDTMITVSSSAGFPTAPFSVIIGGSEELNVTATNGNSWTVTRASEPQQYLKNVALPHNAGDQITVMDSGDLGAASTGQRSNLTIGGNPVSPLAVVLLPWETNVGAAAHETGHGFGLVHSRAFSSATIDYQDCGDIMSFDGCRPVQGQATSSVWRFQGNYGLAGVLNDSLAGAAGPGMNAINLDKLNWIPGGISGPHELSFDNSSCNQSTLQLHSLNDYLDATDGSNLLEVRVPASQTFATMEGSTTSDYYTVEYREASGWDAGFPANSVLVHLHGQDGYSYWEDSAGHQGALYPGDEYIDAANNTYLAVNSTDTVAHTATITLGGCALLANLTLSGDKGPVDYNDGPVTLAADLTVGNGASPVPNAPVTLSLNGPGGVQSCSNNTNPNGHVSCQLQQIALKPGSYTLYASFAGDSAYAQATALYTPFTINPEQSQLTYTGPSTADYNDPTSFTAHLIDPADNTSISGQSVSFDLGNGDTCSAFTDASGNATCSITPQQAPGSPLLSVSFSGGGGYYNGAGVVTPSTVSKDETKLTYTGPLTTHYHDQITAAATLTDPDGGAALPGKLITFTLGAGDSCNATTDASGKASCPLTPHQTGTKNLVATFATDTYYMGATDTRSLTINPEETTISYTGPTVILAGASGATLTGTLVEDGGKDNDSDGGSPGPVPAETVTLWVGSQSCTGSTDATGHVTCTVTSVSVPLGPETVKASFAGDASYQAATDSKTAIVFRFPTTGVFALGDLTVAASPATTVTWWNNNWYLLNSLSGGIAPSAFKGFAATVPLPTTTPANICGGNWTTEGGNSSTPPTSVPSYMGVIVTSKVTKAPGNTAAGNYAKIVVVKTNPGYAPGPMNAGTGTIVASFCP
jgi:hypothetical protein